jgi:hypothetical protein
MRAFRSHITGSSFRGGSGRLVSRTIDRIGRELPSRTAGDAGAGREEEEAALAEISTLLLSESRSTLLDDEVPEGIAAAERVGAPAVAGGLTGFSEATRPEPTAIASGRMDRPTNRAH